MGNELVQSFCKNLDPADKRKVEFLFAALAENGRIANREQFRRVNRVLWEFKSYQLRVFGDFRPGDRFVVVYGTVKKSNKLAKREIEVAERLMSEWDSREGERRVG